VLLLISAQELYDLAIGLLGPSASRDATSVHIITSVGKTQNVEQAYHYLAQAALRGHRSSMELVAWAQLAGPLPLDIKAAMEKFEKLANEGFPSSQTVSMILNCLAFGILYDS
jgi:TPR repeat protein